MALTHRRQITCVLLALGCVGVETRALAADGPNWELFLKKAVHKELKLTDQQQSQVDELIEELKDATEWQTARGDGHDLERYQKHFKEELEKQGRRFMQLLEPEQRARFLQIDLQVIGRERALSKSRVRQSLDLTEQQISELDRIFTDTKGKIAELASNEVLDTRALKQRFEQIKTDCLNQELAVLTEQQRHKYDELFGKPFDLELLETASGAKPRALTVVFPSRGSTAWFFLASEKMQQVLDLNSDQVTKIKAILENADKDLTAIRLGILKKIDGDFRDLKEDEKRRTAKQILIEAAPLHRKTLEQIQELLTPEQATTFDKQIIRIVGPRAVEADSVAARLKLTREQKAALSKLTATFDETTAPWIVVRRHDDLSPQYDVEREKLDEAIKAILTSKQLEMLEFKEDDTKETGRE